MKKKLFYIPLVFFVLTFLSVVKASEDDGAGRNQAELCIMNAVDPSTGQSYTIMRGTNCTRGGTGCTANPCIFGPGW